MKTIFKTMAMAAVVAAAGCATNETAPAAAAPAAPKPAEKPAAAQPAAKPAPAKPAAKPAPKPRNAQERLRAFVREVNDPAKKIGTVEAVAKLEDYRAKNPDCTNLAIRVDLDYAILDRCDSERTPRGAAFDAKCATETMLKVAPRIYGDPKVDVDRKLNAVRRHCTYLCDEKRCDEAVAIAKRMTEQTGRDGKPSVGAFTTLKAVCRLADRYPEAKAAMEKAISLAPKGRDHLRSEASALALEFGDVKSVPGFWKSEPGQVDAYQRICWVLEHRGELDEVAAFRDETLAEVMPYVLDAKNGGKRFNVATRAWFLEDSPRGAALRGAVRDLTREGKVGFRAFDLRWAFMDGAWKRFAAVYEDLEGIRELKAPEMRRAHVFALAALGRTADAKAAAAKYRVEFAKDEDKMRLDVLLAVVEDRDALPVIEAAKLEPKVHARAVQLASQWALVLQKNDACRRYSDVYAKLFAPIPVRRQNVAWSAKPLACEADWRALRPTLEKSWIDVKMCGDLENLVTDVATGRTLAEKTEKDTKDAKVELTSCCDVKGLHVFMRVMDPNARAVEEGFAGGKSWVEGYFAPGDNEPYVCFCGEAHNPVTSLFQTSYTWAGHRRLAINKPQDPCNMTGETWFSDGDYVMHLFFPWDAFYQKLPTAPGSEWKFECLLDGYSWGGSQGIHESSSWGRFVFNLKPGEITAIRRRLLLKNYKTWKSGGPRPYATVGTFDRWADPVIGDPDFHKAALKPLEDELTGYAKRVKPEMTDADVNEIYEKAVPRWIGLKHEIDRLRREYLTKKNLGL